MWPVRRVAAWLLVSLGMAFAPGLAAEPQIEPLGIVTTDQSAQVGVQMAFDLPASVEEALHRGVPLWFSAELAWYQERWYWMDRLVAKSQRYWRLSYQPLTRRYRLQVSPQPIESSGLGVGLAQTYDTLGDALSALYRIGAWTLNTGPLDAEARHRVEFRFRLEPNPLLRPWLAGGGDSDWGLVLQRSQTFKVGGRP
jgi:hypothetical protein